MTDFLISHFALPGAVDDAAVRASYGRVASVTSIACNALLFVGKGAAGLAVGSIAIVADAVNNLADASSNVVALIGFRLAGKPPDAEHPYGHGRAEYLSALCVAVLIALAGLTLARDSIARIVAPQPVDLSAAAVVTLVVSVAVKLWMARFNAAVGRRISSDVLGAVAADARNDAIVTTAVLTSVLVARASGLVLDGWVGLGVGACIVWGGVTLARSTVDTLLGRGPSPELVGRIRERIVSAPGVVGVHGLMVHDYGPGRLYASAHVEVGPDGSVAEYHELVDALERDLWDAEHITMTLHLDPFERGDGSATDLASPAGGGPARPRGRDHVMTSSYKAKQMIVMRRDLKMRKGKIAAQAGHACVEVTLMALAREGRLAEVRVTPAGDWVYLEDARGEVTPLKSWFDAGVAKVCVYVDGEDALIDLAARGRARGFVCALVRDAGLTEFGGEPTYTCLAFEPLYPEQIDPLTGDLPLY